MNSPARDPETYAVIGAAMDVHRVLGFGFLEAVYHAALAVELTARDIPFRREAPLSILYRGEPLPVNYKVDFICFGSLIVELKALTTLTGREESQTLNYLKASGYGRALLINFGTPSLEYRRIAY